MRLQRRLAAPLMLVAACATGSTTGSSSPPSAQVTVLMASVEATFITVTECESKGSIAGPPLALGPLADARGANVVVVYTTATTTNTQNNVTTFTSIMSSGRSHHCPIAAIDRLLGSQGDPR